MKTKNLITMLLIALTLSANAQLSQNIQGTFKSKYPDGTIKRYHHLRSDYVVIFKDGGEKYHATFNEKGEWVETTIKKSWNQMPTVVKKALIVSKYGEWQEFKSFQVETPTGTLYSFDVVYEKEGDGPPNNVEYHVYFTPTGNIAKEVRLY